MTLTLRIFDEAGDEVEAFTLDTAGDGALDSALLRLAELAESYDDFTRAQAAEEPA